MGVPERSARSASRGALLVALTDWRSQRDAGAFEALSPPSGRKPPKQTRWRRNWRVRRENSLKQRGARRSDIDSKKKLRRCWAAESDGELDERRGGSAPGSGLIAAACTALGCRALASSPRPRRQPLRRAPAADADAGGAKERKWCWTC